MPKTTRKLTLADLRRKMPEGATLDTSNPATYYIDAPPGKLWYATSTHGLTLPVAQLSSPDPELRQDSYAAAIDDMQYGLEDCDDPDCEFCHPDDQPDAR